LLFNKDIEKGTIFNYV